MFAYGSEGRLNIETEKNPRADNVHTDQATGSTYCLLIPYWSSKLNKSFMKVKQVSERTGVADVENTATIEGCVTVAISGVKVMKGKILVPRSESR